MFISGHLIVRETTNYGRMLLEACLNSVKDFCDEIIIVDNGCSEQVNTLLYNAIGQWDRGCFVNSDSSSFSKLRNLAIEEMCPKTDYIFQFDADDIFYEDRLKVVRDVLAAGKEADYFGYFFHLMETPTKFQECLKHTNLYKVGKGTQWVKDVHEQLQREEGYAEVNSQLIWTHWGYTKSVIAIAIKWVHYQVLEKGNADFYKEDHQLWGKFGIQHILQDRRPLLKSFISEYPGQAQKILKQYERSDCLDWQDWVTNYVDPEYGEYSKLFDSITSGWTSPENSIDYIIDKKLWEKI